MLETELLALDAATFDGNGWIMPFLADDLATTMAAQKLVRWRAGRWEITSGGHRERLKAKRH